MDDLDIMRETAKVSATIAASPSTTDVVAKAMHVAKLLGYHSVGVVKKAEGKGGELMYFSGAPADIETYKRGGMIKDDPLVNRGVTSEFPQSGREIAAHRLSEAERKVLSYIAKAAGSGDSLVIPVRRSACASGVIVFGGLKPDTRPAARAALTILGHCAYGRIAELSAVETPASEPKIRLSPRECEVLSWVAKGKCDSEIAIILGMSERTARFHVANAKAKLDTSTRVQAVTRALELGLIEG